MSEWSVCQIDDLGEINRGKSKHRPRNDSILFGGKYPFIQTADVKKANLYITEYEATYSDIGLAQSKLWKKGTLCITIAANIAESAILGIDACFPDSVVGFIPFEKKSDIRFVKYLLDEFKVYMQQISKGTTQDNLSLEKLRRVKFRAPNYDIQVKIANTIAAYDDLIENNNKRIKILEQIAENLYKEWFVRFRFPGHETIPIENGIPKGWRIDKIENISNVTDGVHNTIQDTPNSPYLLLSCKNIKDGKIQIGENERTIDEKTFFTLRKRTQLSKGDILITSVGTIGDVHLLNQEPSYIEFQRSVAIIKPNKELVNSCYLYETFKSMRKEFENAAHGAAQQCLFIGDINRMKVCLPPFKICQLFEKKVQQIYDLILTLSNQCDNLIKQRDLLLPRLMSGKLAV